jgi:predicted negative regulator of RcsB-dependent stress response
MSKDKDGVERKSFNDAVADFARQHRKEILIACISIAAAVILVVGGILIFQAVESSNIAKVEELAAEYDALAPSLAGDADGEGQQ